MNAMKRIRGRLGVLAVGVLAVQACADSSGSSAPLALALTADGKLDPMATVGTIVAPSVVLLDERNRPVSSAAIVFEVTAGGGSLAAATVLTDGSGRAQASWTLGTKAGTNTVAARPPTGSTVSFHVSGVAGAPAVLEATTTMPPAVPVSGAVAPAPAVRVLDRYSNPVGGASVAFTVTRGGGSVASPSALANTEGFATAGAWTAGAAGVQEVTASVAGAEPVLFTTQAVSEFDGLARLTKFGGDETTCPVGTSGCRFTVQVLNGSGAPVAGEAVQWRGPGGTTSTTVSGRTGFTSSPNLGSLDVLGSHTQSAQLVGTGAEVVFGYQLVPAAGFDIDIRYVGDASPAVRTAFDNARARWQQVITGNQPEFSLTGANAVAANACGISHPAVNEVVDDLLVFVEVVPIDGPGKVLGSAGPCMIRGVNNLPILGVVKLDSADLALMDSRGTLRDVILHELGHVLGMGTLWSRFSLVQGAGTDDPYYTGSRAGTGFVLGGGTILNGVPLENTGGSGTRDAHWRESTLASELMTGFINGASNPLSTITVGSLMDMGYQVNFGAADGYALPGVLAPHSRLDAVIHEMVELPLPAPRRVW
jgi:hypothetical protein